MSVDTFPGFGFGTRKSPCSLGMLYVLFSSSHRISNLLNKSAACGDWCGCVGLIGRSLYLPGLLGRLQLEGRIKSPVREAASALAIQISILKLCFPSLRTPPFLLTFSSKSKVKYIIWSKTRKSIGTNPVCYLASKLPSFELLVQFSLTIKTC